MCTLSKKNPELKIATEDIVVFKQVCIIEKRLNWFQRFFCRAPKITLYISWTRCFFYIPNKVYETTLDEFKRDSNGFYYSGRGFYSYKNKIGNVKCIIPKGAKYYVAHDEHSQTIIYHSNKIEIVSVL